MTRQSSCGPQDSRERRRYAVEQLALAELGDPWDSAAERKASGGCAVLAGIAAADAICCRRLGIRSRGQDHRAAIDLLRKVVPDGQELAKKLDVLLASKDAMQYGTDFVSAEQHRRVLRAARQIVDAASRIAT